MKDIDPLKIKSTQELIKFNDHELTEIRSMCEYYIEENSHFELDEKQIVFLEEIIALIEHKTATGDFDFSYKYLKNNDLIRGAFDIAVNALTNSKNLLWFVLLKYKGKVVFRLVSRGDCDAFPKSHTKETDYDDNIINEIIKNEWAKISAYAFCQTAKVEIDNSWHKAILVEFGSKNSFSDEFWYQRISLDESFNLLDNVPIYLSESDSRSEFFD